MWDAPSAWSLVLVGAVPFERGAGVGGMNAVLKLHADACVSTKRMMIAFWRLPWWWWRTVATHHPACRLCTAVQQHAQSCLLWLAHRVNSAHMQRIL